MRIHRALSMAAVLVEVADAAAQTPAYPTKPIRMIVPFAAGGPADATARTLAPRLTEMLGQQVIIDNRGGAGGVIGIDMVAKAPPDGHNVTMMSSSIAIFPSIFKTLPYDMNRDLAPVTDVLSAPFSLVIHPSVPARNAGELAKLARAKPGELRYPSAGAGGTNHLAGVLFNLMAGVDTSHVPYKVTGPALKVEFARVLAIPAVRLRLSPGGAQLGGNTPEAFAAFVRSEVAKWAKVVKVAGIAQE